jgi:hypothetical protein
VRLEQGPVEAFQATPSEAAQPAARSFLTLLLIFAFAATTATTTNITTPTAGDAGIIG